MTRSATTRAVIPGVTPPLIESLPPSAAADAERVQHWHAKGLPVPPSWRVRGTVATQWDASELAAALTEAAGPQPGRYWLLHQGPATPGSLRESLANLDSDQALAAALLQLFGRPDAPEQVIVQSLPVRQAAGVLFTRHPVRQDLDHVVVEGVVEQGDGSQARLILHRNGEIAFSSGANPLEDTIGPALFAALAMQLRGQFERPQACEWVFDGGQLWLVQTLPVGSLPRPQDAWSRRAGYELWQQAVSPLWYTLAGRWLKTAFWRPLGERLGWHDLGNVEPYRRQHSHLYSNSQFLLRLLETGLPHLEEGVPPAWRPLVPVKAPAYNRRRDGLQPWLAPLRLARLERQLAQLARQVPAASDVAGTWRYLMRLDRLGEGLARLEGWLRYCRPVDTATVEADALTRLARRLPPRHRQALRALNDPAAMPGEATYGVDPVLPRFREIPGELDRLAQVAPERTAVLGRLAEQESSLHGRAANVREQLGGVLRHVLLGMGEVLVARKRLARSEDIFFVYFDELWQLWHQTSPTRPGLETQAKRKLRLLTDAYQGVPDWIIDQVAYGARLDQREKPVLNGCAVVATAVAGPARLVHTGWALAQIEPGDILVLDRYETGWLPWLCLAGGLVLAGHEPDQPAALLAQALGIPCIIGVDDAMHCLVSGSQLTINSPAGVISRGIG